ncbi:hypothetical protein BDZ85DRAFT_111655 [Elsinoe ampelina]|uniref:Zn(2)-C6 fungal-type domain-containing protein n=1 Tax=Elsinoe ampelina TaxID=302913 RepID=A0A6A6GD00_9PEZI|nr:hypothetical protein BDZ85DRAFT_111655 [Elsinoe ampelina]
MNKMSSVSPENTDSPPSNAFGRKNKLGYTRISVACAHCRRRKIRCVLAEGDSERRCANCIKLKKECIFTTVDTASNGDPRASGKAGMNSQASSVMSRSPSGVSPEHRDGINPSPPHLAGGYSDVLPLAGRGSGMMMHSSVLQPDHIGLQRAGNQDWHSQHVDLPQPGYANSQSHLSWSQTPEHLRNYSPGGFGAGGQPIAYGYMDHGRSDGARTNAWATTESTTATAYHSHMASAPTYQGQQSTSIYPASYEQQTASMTTPAVVPSQYYSQRPAQGHPMGESGYNWGMYQQDSGLPGSPRHDSMATNWSRGPSYSGHSFTLGYDPRGTQGRHGKGTTEPPG